MKKNGFTYTVYNGGIRDERGNRACLDTADIGFLQEKGTLRHSQLTESAQEQDTAPWGDCVHAGHAVLICHGDNDVRGVYGRAETDGKPVDGVVLHKPYAHIYGGHN